MQNAVVNYLKNMAVSVVVIAQPSTTFAFKGPSKISLEYLEICLLMNLI